MSSAWGNVFATAPSRNLFSVNTFSDLRTLTPPTGDATLEVDGRAAKNDGFGGIFYFDPNSAAADDNVNTIAPTSGAGRWIRTIVFAALGSFTNLAIGDGIQAAPSLSFSADSDTGFYRRINNTLAVVTGGLATTEFEISVIALGSLSVIRWGDQPTIPAITVIDTGISRTSAGIIEINNGTPGSLATLKAASIVTPFVTAPANTLLQIFAPAIKELQFGANNTLMWQLQTSGHLLPVTGDNAQDFGDASHRIRTGYFGTSVVTPLVAAASGTALNLSADGGSGHWQIPTSANLIPVTDNARTLGDATHRVANVFTPIIDSGTTGSLSLKTNNGGIGLRIDNIPSAVVQYAAIPEVTGGKPRFVAIGEATVGAILGSAGSGDVDLVTSNTEVQTRILRTASANRSITLTGSNGGNPTINVTGGSLAITPDVVIAGASISVGTTPATSGTIRIPYGVGITSRNQANSGDRDLLKLITRNSVADVLSIAGGASIAGLELQATVRSGAPTTSDIISGTWALWRDTSGATTRLYYNNAGTLQFVALV